nr:uncharacterized protein LOC124806284 [Hydra vulgaris]
MLIDTCLYQHVNTPTFQISNEIAVSILDLIFTTESGKVCAIDTQFTLDEINCNDVLKRLQSLYKNKAFGPDKLHPAMLKNASEAFALPLTLIFRESLASSQLPIQFRSANITPLFKKGDKAVAANKRPVSLTPVVCKILEEHQHGFIKNKCCTTNLLETIDFITLNIESHTPIDVVLLDFAKAFDTVPHNRLLLKLRAHGIDGLVLKWIESYKFLTNRRQRVVKGDIVSNWVEVFSGVPQDSGFENNNIIKAEAIANCESTEKWAGFLCLLGLSLVLSCNIVSCYPDFGVEKYKIFFNQAISPLTPIKLNRLMSN